MTRRKMLAEQILEDLVDYDYARYSTQEEKEEALNFILKRLDNFILVIGEVI